MDGRTFAGISFQGSAANVAGTERQLRYTTALASLRISVPTADSKSADSIGISGGANRDRNAERGLRDTIVADSPRISRSAQRCFPMNPPPPRTTIIT